MHNPCLLKRLNAKEVQSLKFNALPVKAPFGVIYCKKNALQYGRLGIIVPKRLVHLATQRNRIKRVFRETIRLMSDKINGLDILIKIQVRSTNIDNNGLKTWLEKFFTKLRQSMPNSSSV